MSFTQISGVCVTSGATLVIDSDHYADVSVFCNSFTPATVQVQIAGVTVAEINTATISSGPGALSLGPFCLAPGQTLSAAGAGGFGYSGKLFTTT